MSDEHEQPQVPQHPEQPEQPEQPQPAAAPGTDQREWVAVPPPNPYAAQPPAARPAAGKGLAITAMALGLVALLTVLVSVFYFSPAIAVITAAAGLAAIVVGVIAMVRRSRPLGAAIAGAVTGALALVIVAVLAVVGALTQVTQSLGGQQTEPGESWSPDSEQETLLDWPANMATGGIVFTGPDDASTGSAAPLPLPSDPLEPGVAPLPNEIDRESANDVLIYVDYSCPHCAAFEQGSGELLKQAIIDGGTTVEVVPLSFMDRASSNAYSSRAAGAVACLADSQPEAAWAGHNALLDPAVQPSGGPGLTNEQIVQLFDEAAGGLNDQASDCILNERFVSFAQSLNDWVFQNPVPNISDTESRIQGTPSIFVNGVYYEGGAEDPEAFRKFFEEQTN